MTFNEFHDKMISFVVFSYEDISMVFGGIDRRRIYEWSKKGYIIPLVKGYYLFSEFRDAEYLGSLISNKLNEPSYVSLEYILSTEGVIPESVYSFTAVTTGKTSEYNTLSGTYNYRNIKPELFLGYDLTRIKINLSGKVLDRFVKVACLEKAFFDFLYLNRLKLTDEEIAGYRFDTDKINQMDKDRLFGYADISGKKTITATLKKILGYHAVY
jgi:hypothetical protein